MPNYSCECCEYTTTVKQSLKIHNRTQKHKTLAEDNSLYPCKYCGLICENSKKRYRHMQKCDDKDLQPVKKKSGNDNKGEKYVDALIAMAKDNTKIAQTAVESSLENAKTTGKSVNMMKYAVTYFKDAPPLVSLDQNQVFQMLEYDNNNTEKPKDEINSDYITPILYHYENKEVDSFFSKLIVNFFSTEELKDRKFWTTDVSRLSFIVMQVVNKKGEKEWNYDKTGKKFIDMVIDPMFVEVDKLLDEFVANKQKWIDENYGKVYIAPSKMTYLMKMQQLARELQLEIKYSKFNTDILKFVAPFFNFDSIRLAEEKRLELDKTIEKPNDKPKKKVTKVLKQLTK